MSEAERLANILGNKIPSIECLERAAAEMRRLSAEVEALRKALQDIASGELGVNLCVRVAKAAIAARPGASK